LLKGISASIRRPFPLTKRRCHADGAERFCNDGRVTQVAGKKEITVGMPKLIFLKSGIRTRPYFSPSRSAASMCSTIFPIGEQGAPR
jgi:hypothetical protein